jgi:molybdopterin-guanine dinucleotide biosynthesis protein A
MKYQDISAVILAGGRNTRMGGRDKALLRVEGQPIIERSISVLREIFQEIVIVTNDTRAYEYDGVKIVKDEIKNIGPLGGIYTGLRHVTGNAGFFVACDMPFLHNGSIRQQIEFFNQSPCEALVPKINAHIEPLHAVYSKIVRERIASFIKDTQECAIKDFLKTINTCYFGLDDTVLSKHCFKNLNTPVDFKYSHSHRERVRVRGRNW